LTLIQSKESTATDGTAQPKMTAQPQVRIIGICSKNIKHLASDATLIDTVEAKKALGMLYYTHHSHTAQPLVTAQPQLAAQPQAEAQPQMTAQPQVRRIGIYSENIKHLASDASKRLPLRTRIAP
jgi:hypothetical protein